MRPSRLVGTIFGKGVIGANFAYSPMRARTLHGKLPCTRLLLYWFAVVVKFLHLSLRAVGPLYSKGVDTTTMTSQVYIVTSWYVYRDVCVCVCLPFSLAFHKMGAI